MPNFEFGLQESAVLALAMVMTAATVACQNAKTANSKNKLRLNISGFSYVVLRSDRMSQAVETSMIVDVKRNRALLSWKRNFQNCYEL